MIVFESREVRRIVGRLERGENVLSAFERLARERGVRSGFLSGQGAFEWVELAVYDPDAQSYGPPRRFDSSCEVLSAFGNVSEADRSPDVQLRVTVARETDNGLEVLGGRVMGASVLSFEFVVEAYDDLALVREHDDDTGLALWVGPSVGSPRATKPAPSSSGGVSWAQVAEVSESRPERPMRSARSPRPEPRNMPLAPAPTPIPERRRVSEEEFLSELTPEKGDWVDHRQFGLCRVDGDDPQGGLIIRLPSGVRKTINLDYLEVLEPRSDEGRRIFPLRPRRPR